MGGDVGLPGPLNEACFVENVFPSALPGEIPIHQRLHITFAPIKLNPADAPACYRHDRWLNPAACLDSELRNALF